MPSIISIITLLACLTLQQVSATQSSSFQHHVVNSSGDVFGSPYIQRSQFNSKYKFRWVAGVHTDWINSSPYGGAYLAAQTVTDEHLYLELGVLGQRFPRIDAAQPDKTRYFLTLRIGMDHDISPFLLAGFNPVHLTEHWFSDEKESRMDVTTQVGVSWKIQPYLRLDAYAAWYSFETRKPFHQSQHGFDRDMQSAFQRQHQWATGVRASLMF